MKKTKSVVYCGVEKGVESQSGKPGKALPEGWKSRFQTKCFV